MKGAFSIFSFRGRISRGNFWWKLILVLAVFMIASSLLVPNFGATSTWLLNPLALWAMCALTVRRLHDRNFSGRWLLIMLLPIGGAVWLLWQLAIRKGIDDPNRWGNNPLASNVDFLVVR
jgi:uncharacterized membrane protein YhaH (DUF805 family)